MSISTRIQPPSNCSTNWRRTFMSRAASTSRIKTRDSSPNAIRLSVAAAKSSFPAAKWYIPRPR